MAPNTHVTIHSVSKRFGGVKALIDIDLAIERGSIHGLVGENGAGKSTLGKIIAGALRPNEGEIVVDGRPVHYVTPHDALAEGITMIHQEIALVPQLTVLENVYLGIESRQAGVIQKRDLRRRFEELIARSHFDMPPGVLVSSLSVSNQKKVEILKAVARNARLIVMDEPTAALPDDETAKLIEVIHSLREAGTTIVYISHFLEEILSLADTVTVLRNGELIRTTPTQEETPESLVLAMLGRSISLTFTPKRFPPPDAPIVFSARDLCREGAIDEIAFDIRAGEIVGLAGLIGSGRSEVARTIFGADRRDAGTVMIDGRPVKVDSPSEAVNAGIAMLPESRKDQGLLMGMSVGHNVSLPHLPIISRGFMVERGRELRETTDLLKELDVRPPQPAIRVDSLSGGNQQKVLFAKWLFRRPRLLIADEPTHGVDVGAKRAIYRLLTSLAEDGIAVLLISSELEEVLGLSHRVLVMRLGRIVAEFVDSPDDHSSLTEDAVMRAAFATK
ncbi:MAG: sugar ABC transporter ATP-binding protein [Anaerolineales bacterium]|nr:MAG: sugar ABC transporter ATP-binding protein [Anaerolineales bacterium]TEU11268.1 MAG: sugar ABC transporter ATP-binding protein [Anaerolineales bacterium]